MASTHVSASYIKEPKDNDWFTSVPFILSFTQNSRDVVLQISLAAVLHVVLIGAIGHQSVHSHEPNLYCLSLLWARDTMIPV